MFKLFNGARQDSILKNRIGKYLLYAAGEIILVVIGILIAVSINNMNKAQSDKEAEIIHLNQIKLSLEENFSILESRMSQGDSLLKYSRILFDHLKAKSELTEFTKSALFIPNYDYSIRFNLGAFENFKNNGLPLMSNDSLKSEIINMYDQDLEYIHVTFAQEMEDYINSVINPYYAKHFEFTKATGRIQAIPNDYNELLNDPQMTNIISFCITLREFSQELYQRTNDKIELQIEAIDKEIVQLEKTL